MTNSELYTLADLADEIRLYLSIKLGRPPYWFADFPPLNKWNAAKQLK